MFSATDSTSRAWSSLLQSLKKNQKPNTMPVWQFHSAATCIISLIKNVRNPLSTRIHHWSVSQHQVVWKLHWETSNLKYVKNISDVRKYSVLNPSLQKLVFLCFYSWKVRRKIIILLLVAVVFLHWVLLYDIIWWVNSYRMVYNYHR